MEAAENAWLGSGYKKDQRGLSTAWSEQTLLSYIARVNYNYAGNIY